MDGEVFNLVEKAGFRRKQKDQIEFGQESKKGNGK
jgi:hypothetical protein